MKWLVCGALLLVVSYTYGALNKTYPTSATTNLRIETYTDAFSTIWKSTAADESVKMALINEIADSDIEQYLVLPSTYDFTGSWEGWCLSIVTENVVPVACGQ